MDLWPRSTSGLLKYYLSGLDLVDFLYCTALQFHPRWPLPIHFVGLGLNKIYRQGHGESHVREYMKCEPQQQWMVSIWKWQLCTWWKAAPKRRHHNAQIPIGNVLILTGALITSKQWWEWIFREEACSKCVIRKVVSSRETGSHQKVLPPTLLT